METLTRKDLLLHQLDESYRALLDRMAGMTDAEYRWEPVAGGVQRHGRRWDGAVRGCVPAVAGRPRDAAGSDLDVVGRSQMPYGLDPDLPFGEILWWNNRELIHHGAEIALLRDLWAHSAGGTAWR